MQVHDHLKHYSIERKLFAANSMTLDLSHDAGVLVKRGNIRAPYARGSSRLKHIFSSSL